MNLDLNKEKENVETQEIVPDRWVKISKSLATLLTAVTQMPSTNYERRPHKCINETGEQTENGYELNIKNNQETLGKIRNEFVRYLEKFNNCQIIEDKIEPKQFCTHPDGIKKTDKCTKITYTIKSPSNNKMTYSDMHLLSDIIEIEANNAYENLIKLSTNAEKFPQNKLVKLFTSSYLGETNEELQYTIELHLISIQKPLELLKEIHNNLSIINQIAESFFNKKFDKTKRADP